MNKKVPIPFALLLLCTFSLFFIGCTVETVTNDPVPNDPFSGEDGYFTCTASGTPYSVTITGLSSKWTASSDANKNNLIIPDTIQGYPVTAIGVDAFKDRSTLVSVTIPNSVKSIGDYAFTQCTGLTSISVDPTNPNYSSTDGVLYDRNKTILICFTAGKSGTYTIPNSVTSIGYYAFDSCTGLTSVTMYPTTPPTTNATALPFFNCTALTAIKVPSASLSAYKSAPGWSSYKNIIVSQ